MVRRRFVRVVGAAAASIALASCSILAGDGPRSPSRTACAGWRVEASPNAGPGNNFLTAVAASSPTDVWAVGAYKAASGRARPLTMHFDGRSWRATTVAVGSGDAFLNGVWARSPGDAWAVGVHRGPDGVARSFALHWDGRAWARSPSPNASDGDNFLTAITGSADGTIWAAGYDEERGRFHALLMRHDAGGWTVERTPDPPGLGAGLNAVVASADGSLWAAGAYTPNGSPTRPLILRGSPEGWRVSPSPATRDTPSSISGLTATPRGLVAVGAFRALRGDGALALARASGRWSFVARSTVGRVSESFSAVAASGGGAVYAVGSYSDGILQRTLVERMSETRWTHVETPNVAGSDSKLFGVAALPSGDVWAVGNASGPDAVERTLVERFCPS